MSRVTRVNRTKAENLCFGTLSGPYMSRSNSEGRHSSQNSVLSAHHTVST